MRLTDKELIFLKEGKWYVDCGDVFIGDFEGENEEDECLKCIGDIYDITRELINRL